MATPTKKKLNPKNSGLSSLMRRAGKLAGKANSSSKLREAFKKSSDRMLKDLKDATKKMTVHQEPRSKSAASLRSLIDQKRYKVPKSPHKDKKKSKYAGIFKKPDQKKRPKGKT